MSSRATAHRPSCSLAWAACKHRRCRCPAWPGGCTRAHAWSHLLASSCALLPILLPACPCIPAEIERLLPAHIAPARPLHLSSPPTHPRTHTQRQPTQPNPTQPNSPHAEPLSRRSSHLQRSTTEAGGYQGGAGGGRQASCRGGGRHCRRRCHGDSRARGAAAGHPAAQEAAGERVEGTGGCSARQAGHAKWRRQSQLLQALREPFLLPASASSVSPAQLGAHGYPSPAPT